VTPRAAVSALVLGTSALTAGISSAGLEASRAGRGQAAQVLYLPSGEYLRIVSLGFPELLADVIYIWSIQYYSNYEVEDRFRYLEHVYGNVISELDPRYIDPYLVGSLIMSVEAKDHEMALRLLEKGMDANPEEWILPFEAGFTCFQILKDYRRAAAYFERAMDIPGAPPPIRRMYAEMFNRIGDKQASLAHWRNIYESADNDHVKDISWRHVHDLTIECDIEALTDAVESYRAREGRPPRELEDLRRSGLIAMVPVDPDGEEYVYDSATGKVSSASRWRLYRKMDR